MFDTHATHSDLSRHLEVRFGRRPRHGWFLRAETFYGLATHVTTDDGGHGVARYFPNLHGQSHGESFLSILAQRCAQPGLYLMDEPESALSFHGQLQLLAMMADGIAAGSQIVLATHSPLLMAMPGARLWDFDDGAATVTTFDDVETVALWRRFLDDPDVFVRALLPERPREGRPDPFTR